MKEEEAKTKWCPHVRNNDPAFEENAVVSNRYNGKIEKEHLCIASDCMMWVEEEWSKEPIEGQIGHFINEPSGHCGLTRGVK